MMSFTEISTQKLPTCAAPLFCLQLDLQLVNNGEGQLPWHGTDENHSTTNKKDRRKNWGLNALVKESGIFLHPWESSYGLYVPLKSHSYTINNRSPDTVAKILNTKWIVTVSYEKPLPEMAENQKMLIQPLPLWHIRQRETWSTPRHFLLYFTLRLNSPEDLFHFQKAWILLIVYCSSLLMFMKVQTGVMLSGILTVGCTSLMLHFLF